MFSKQLNKEYMVMEKVNVYLGKTGSNELDIDMMFQNLNICICFDNQFR